MLTKHSSNLSPKLNSTAVNAKMTQTKYKPLACNSKAISEKLISAVCSQDP